MPAGALQAAAQLAARSEGDSTFLARTMYVPYVIPCLRRLLAVSRRVLTLGTSGTRARARCQTRTQENANADSRLGSFGCHFQRSAAPTFYLCLCACVCAFALRCLLRRGELLLGGRAWAWDVCGRILVFSHHALRLVTGKLCCSQPSTA